MPLSLEPSNGRKIDRQDAADGKVGSRSMSIQARSSTQIAQGATFFDFLPDR
jgi:hypothetical protein